MRTKVEGHLLSPLSQHIERDGHTVRIEIYGDGQGMWIADAVDKYGNSTTLGTSFETDQFALDEALRRIDADGISTLVGTEPSERG